jgi:phthalate 4,5-dioxygenase
MLSREENELLTRVGPGTPMGALFRRFWLPAMMASELPGPDCPPVRLRLLGEDLVAFRDSSGRVGVLGALCAHRCAPLFFGRNEANGLRCVYHGWKYDVTGQCVDMPNEPPESNFKHKVQQRAYPVREAGQVLWVYMGPPDRVPPLPDLEWLHLPPEHVYVHKRLQECNYLQNLEGELDSSHVSFLHARWDGYFGPAGHPLFGDTAPRFQVLETDYGLLIGARRDAEDDSYYWRITQFLLPSYTIIPPRPGAFLDFTAAIPVDDENMIGLTIGWRPDRPLDGEDRAKIESWDWVYPEVEPGSFRTVRNQANDYQLDREMQRTVSFTGIKGLRDQDAAVQEGMGAICDRTQEHLGSADAGVIQARRLLLRLVRELQQGQEPHAAEHGELYGVRAVQIILKRGVPFQEGAKEALIATAPGPGATE